MFVDSHAHIGSKELSPEILHILTRGKEAQVSCIINVSCAFSNLEENILFTKAHTSPALPLYTTIGVHPDHYNKNDGNAAFQEEIHNIQIRLEELLAKYTDSIVALGECGLDYYWPHNKAAQQALFRMHLALSEKVQLPTIIHVRNAWDDFFEIMSEFPNTKGVVHCFSGSKEDLTRVLAFPNMLVSFTGVITFKSNKEAYKEILEHIPMDRFMIETDAPYLSPVPHRGKTNEPSYVVEIAREIANVKNISLDDVGTATKKNAELFFGKSFTCT